MRLSPIPGKVVAMLGNIPRWCGCILAVVLALSTVESAPAKERPDFCGRPPTRPVAELLPLAKAGDAEAQYLLGLKFEVGYPFKNKWSEGAAWYRRAAEQGHIAATAALGLMFLKGKGLPKDIDKGLRLMRRAANKGRVCTQTGLGYYLLGVSGVPPDLGEAEKWFRRAAEEGHSVAQQFLAELYSGSFGGEADRVEALRWTIVRDEFHPGQRIPDIIRKIRDRILPSMSAEDIAEAERRAQAWLARHRG